MMKMIQILLIFITISLNGILAADSPNSTSPEPSLNPPKLTTLGSLEHSSTGKCYKKNRKSNVHSIPALNLEIPIDIYDKGVDASLKYALSKLPVKGSSGSLLQDCLQSHNQYRALVGLPLFKWSNEAQKVAQRWANHLASNNLFYHSHTKGFGENLFMQKGMSDSCDFAVRNWFDEYPLYPSNLPIGKGDFEGYGHYTQLIWPSTTSVGCAQATGPNGGVTTVCEYVPPGNMLGKGIKKAIA